MRILYLANLRLPTEKAYGIQIAKMCEAFANSGHEVKLLHPYRKNLAINQDLFSYYSVKNNFTDQLIKSPDFYLSGFLDKISFLIKNYLSAKALIREAFKENADIYYTRDERIAYILNKKNKNVIFECHRFSNNKKGLYPYFKKIIAISSGLKEDLVKSGVKDENILVARDGVDLDMFNFDMTKEEARNKCGLPLDKKIIMYSGHLFEWKGASLLLEVASNFQKKEDILFIFVGGTEYDLAEFKSKARDLDNVLILGHKPYVEIPKLLSSADILVLPNSAKQEISQKYTSPLKLFEYMASDRPIIASDLPSIREVLNDQNAYFFKANDSISLAETIEKVLGNKIDAEEKAKLALEDVQKYTWQKRAEKILDFIGS